MPVLISDTASMVLSPQMLHLALPWQQVNLATPVYSGKQMLRPIRLKGSVCYIGKYELGHHVFVGRKIPQARQLGRN